MGNLVGHVAPGLGFLLIGLWHLFSHIKLHSLHPTTYMSSPWFPVAKFRYTEPVIIIIGSTLSIAMELFIGPARHQPLDDDWTIPANHLRNFEHASISFSFLIFAAFSIILDRIRIPSQTELRAGLTQVLAAFAFGQELVMFHLHSTDHMGMEGEYHWLLQVVVFCTLATTLIGIPLPKSFLIGFLRSVSIVFQGAWFIVMGYALWTPGLIPKGCVINDEDGHEIVRCGDDASLERGKSLINIMFSWFMAVMVIFVMVFYLVVTKRYIEEGKYLSLEKEEDIEHELEGLSKMEESERFVHVGILKSKV